MRGPVLERKNTSGVDEEQTLDMIAYLCGGFWVLAVVERVISNAPTLGRQGEEGAFWHVQSIDASIHDRYEAAFDVRSGSVALIVLLLGVV